jgi:Glyoxalase/Bleomycin resistance protein/Dioxygenase superfamily
MLWRWQISPSSRPQGEHPDSVNSYVIPMIKRFDCLDIATTDLADAVSTYQKNFDFSVKQAGEAAIAQLGDAQIRLRSGPSAAVLSSSEEGLAAIWLESDNVEQVAETLRQSGVEVGSIQVQGGRRILPIHPAFANMVPLFIFDRLLP